MRRQNSSERPYVITLGTAGGPRWWPAAGGTQRAGIATAVVVGEAVYLVDCGYGAAGQLARAGISASSVRAVLLTHLHSDHVVDLPALVAFGFMVMPPDDRPPVRLVGPGDRGVLPPVSSHAGSAPDTLFDEDAALGTSAMFTSVLRAFSTDLADRMRDSLRYSPRRFFEPTDIHVPDHVGFHPNDNPRRQTPSVALERDTTSHGHGRDLRIRYQYVRVGQSGSPHSLEPEELELAVAHIPPRDRRASDLFSTAQHPG